MKTFFTNLLKAFGYVIGGLLAIALVITPIYFLIFKGKKNETVSGTIENPENRRDNAFAERVGSALDRLLNNNQ